VRANQVLFRKESEQQLVLYWYIEQGEPEPGELRGALRTLWNGAFRGRTDGCLIRLSATVNGSEEQTLKQELDLLQLALPMMVKNFLPPNSGEHTGWSLDRLALW